MLALGCGLVASIGITQVMAKRNTDAPNPNGEATQIYVALEDIPMGDLVTAELLKLEEWPKDKVPAGALTNIEDVEGRRPKSKVYAGAPLLDNQLLAKGVSQGGAVNQIPPGYRVVSVNVDDETGASDLIRPTDRVDLLLFLQRSPTKGVMDTCTRTILQDIRVFAVNDVFDLESTEGEESINAKTISLLVTPSQAETVSLASELGKIRLVLRSHEDKEEAELGGAFPHQLDKSEMASREKEALPQGPPTAGSGENLNAFLAMLNSRGSQQPEVEESPQDTNAWNIRLIKGSEVSQAVLATEGGPQTPGAKSSGLNVFWKLISPRTTDAGAAEADRGPNPTVDDENKQGQQEPGQTGEATDAGDE